MANKTRPLSEQLKKWMADEKKNDNSILSRLRPAEPKR